MIQERTGLEKAQALLIQKEADLVKMLQSREGIAIQKSADPMDEIQYATERDLAIRSVDRDSTLLRQVRAALGRVRDGTFGVCVDCEEEINLKRLMAVPWAQRCIQCQEQTDRNLLDRTDLLDESSLTIA